MGEGHPVRALYSAKATHHTLKKAGKQPLNLNADGSYKLPPMDAVGSGSVQEKLRAYLAEIIQKVAAGTFRRRSECASFLGTSKRGLAHDYAALYCVLLYKEAYAR